LARSALLSSISNSPILAIGADSLRFGLLFFNPNPSTVLLRAIVQKRQGQYHSDFA